MKVQVKLSSLFKKYVPKYRDKFDMEVEPGTTVSVLIEALGIPPEANRVFFVNGRYAEVNTRLSQGDTVIILPPVGGG